MTEFGKIFLCETGFSNGKTVSIIDTNNLSVDKLNASYFDTLKKYKTPYELIGKSGQQIKPSYDLDPKFDINEKIDISKILKDGEVEIRKYYPTEEIVYYARDIRTINDNGIEKLKFSYHAIVQNVRIKSNNIKLQLEQNKSVNNEPFDHSIYSINRGLYPVFSSKKKGNNGGPDQVLPVFKPIDINGKC